MLVARMVGSAPQLQTLISSVAVGCACTCDPELTN